MNASDAFVNGAGNARRAPAAQSEHEGLRLLNALLSTAASESSAASESTAPSKSNRPAVDKGRSKDERQAEEESSADTVSKPGGFKNDPDDPTNPNEVRERHSKKIRR
jgi:hypothetical protein